MEVLFEGFVVVVGIGGSVEEFDGDGSGDVEVEVSVASGELDVEDSVLPDRVVVPSNLVGHSAGESLFVVFGQVDGLSGNCFHCSV